MDTVPVADTDRRPRLSAVQGGAARGVTLGIAYCLGLGIPFLLFGLGFDRLAGFLKRSPASSPWPEQSCLILIGTRS